VLVQHQLAEQVHHTHLPPRLRDLHKLLCVERLGMRRRDNDTLHYHGIGAVFVRTDRRGRRLNPDLNSGYVLMKKRKSGVAHAETVRPDFINPGLCITP
jgi:hypothetical protein